MCNLSPGWRSAIRPRSAKCPPAIKPTGSFSRSQAAQNQSSEPSDHQLCLMRLVEGEPETEHARPLPPVPDDLLAVRRLQVEIAEDAEFVGMGFDRFDRLHVRPLAEGAGRMDDRRVDPGLGHLLQRVIDIVGRDLAVLRRHPRVFPKVDLQIDDLHRLPPLD